MSGLKARPVAQPYRLPIQETIRDLVGDLLGRATIATKQPEALEGTEVAVVAEYVNQAGAPATLAVCDAGFANGVGGALTLVPIPVVEESTAAGEVPDNLLENVQEVLNIMAKLFNSAAAPHVRLKGLHRGVDELPGPVAELLAGARARKDFAVEVDGYGRGRVALLVS